MLKYKIEKRKSIKKRTPNKKNIVIKKIKTKYDTKNK
jgi:hypothetical protein